MPRNYADRLLGVDEFDNLPDGYYGRVRLDTLCLGRGDERLIDAKHFFASSFSYDPAKCCPYENEVGAVLLGFAVSGCWVCRKCPCNFHCAFCQRHGSIQPTLYGDVRRFDALITPWLVDPVGLHTAHLLWQEDHWIEKWPLSKQKMLLHARELWQPERFSLLSPMIKRELWHRKPRVPRIIQAYACLAAQFALGPGVTALQKTIVELFRHNKSPITIASGMNCAALGDWMRDVQREFGGIVLHYYERDGKKWDATMRREHLEFVVRTFARAGAEASVLAGLLDGIDSKGYASFESCGVRHASFKYKLRGTVKSGHNTTTIGNSLVNGVLALISARDCGIDARVLVAGDDLVMVYPSMVDRADEIAENERSWGITPEYKGFASLHDVTFVSQVWFPTGDLEHPYATCPKTGRLLQRLYWSVNAPVTERGQRAWINSVTTGLLQVCQHIPVLNVWLEHARMLADTDERCTVKEKYMFYYQAGLTVDPKVVLSWYTQYYGLTESLVRDAEDAIRRIPRLGWKITHPVLVSICDHDNVELTERAAVPWAL